MNDPSQIELRTPPFQIAVEISCHRGTDLASIAMPCSTLLQLKGGVACFGFRSAVWVVAAFSLWVALDAATFFEPGLRVDDALARGSGVIRIGVVI